MGEIVTNLVHVLSHLLLSISRIHELHARKLVHKITGVLANHIERDLLLHIVRCAAGFQEPVRLLIEIDKIAKHQIALVERTISIVRSKRVLCKEVFTDHLRDFKCDLIAFRKRVLSDKLDNLHKRIFRLQDLAGLLLVPSEPRILLLVESFKHLGVVRVRVEPIDGGKMLALCEFLVQSPEHLHDTERCRCDGIRKISSRR
mmetsp:Transcript_30388/g.116485  ORF Transcript_30388/g.116485 Transcript_30388/m.116485 type:complete len:202 (+) Transcript_30388:144-749(+)